MFEAHVDSVNEQFDTEMQRTSWFTAMLMNASGNYKKEIKSDKLYEPISKRTSKTVEKVKSYVEEQRELLKKKFNIE